MIVLELADQIEYNDSGIIRSKPFVSLRYGYDLNGV